MMALQRMLETKERKMADLNKNSGQVCVCVCVCVRTCVHACTCVCVYVLVR
jgi:hypothetical protein